MTRNPAGRGAIPLVVAALLWAVSAQANTLAVGVLSYDTFIPGGNGSPGVDAFDLANLTGTFSLPPDFPVADALTFGSVMLTLTLSDLSKNVIALGDLGPGFLLDQNGNPIVQVAGNQVFISAELIATLSPSLLSDGTSLVFDSSSIDVLLRPSSGQTLTADLDQTTILVSGTAVTPTPEPPSVGPLLIFGGLVWFIQTKRVVGEQSLGGRS